ncbi:hypothetical protein AGMMS4957_11700 [Bacteroidia bacterium]|nr:hypothetical protein AGMMS4957_11700 [Bacteroidia bacterium]
MPEIKLFSYPNRDFLISDYNGDINAAITACNSAGGGRVIVPAGEWQTGAIHLKSNVNLHLQENAVLIFSDNPADYLPAVMTSWEGMECYNYSPLLYAFDCENIAITGAGTLQPKMDLWKTWFARPKAHLEALKQLYEMASTDVPVEQRQMAVGENHLRPHLIHFNRCKNVLLDGFKIRESPFWTIHIYMCEGGVARNLDVKAHGDNNDGIDLEMTRNFLVENCLFDQGDDAVVIKSGRNRDAWRLNTPVENIVVRNCKIINGHTLLGIGSELSGGVRNIYMTNCSAENVHRFVFIKTNHRRGGFVENIFAEKLSAGKTQRVFEIDTDVLYQWKDLVPTYETRITRIDGVFLKNITCAEADAVYELKGDVRLPIKNVEIRNIQVGKINQFTKKTENVENILEEADLRNDEPDKVEGQIPILAWGSQRKQTTVEHYRDMADAGFTIDLFCEWAFVGKLPAEKYFSVLDAAHTAGIKVILPIPTALEEFSDADIAKLKAHPALWGYFVIDEPREVSEFPGLSNTVKEIQAFDSGHPCYINLLPYYDKWTSMDNYRNDYIKPFLETVPVPFLSFDKYPIGQKDSNPRTIDPYFYALLEVMSATAKKIGLPLWAFALATAHGSYPIPTLADLRLQVYSDLAYGAQYIQYFTYWTPNIDYHDGPLDIAGNKTPTYDVVKAMNAEIKALSKVFLGSKMVWVAHTATVPRGCKEFNKSQLPAVFKDVEVSQGGVLISLLERGKDNFLVIVNHDINEDAVVKVSAEASVRMIKKDGTVVAADGESHVLTPGDILVHFWKKLSEP